MQVVGQYVALGPHRETTAVPKTQRRPAKDRLDGVRLCATPICTQAEKFTLNAGPAADIREKLLSEAVVTDPGALKDQTITLAGGGRDPIGCAGKKQDPCEKNATCSWQAQTKFCLELRSVLYTELGGRGYDGREDIIRFDNQGNEYRVKKCGANDPETGYPSPCPDVPRMIEWWFPMSGESFPKGCGYDVLDTAAARATGRLGQFLKIILPTASRRKASSKIRTTRTSKDVGVRRV